MNAYFWGLSSRLFLSMGACTSAVRAEGFRSAQRDDLEGCTSALSASKAWERSMISELKLISWSRKEGAAAYDGRVLIKNGLVPVS